MAALKLERVLITDKTDPSCEEILRHGGIAVDVRLKLPKDQLLQEIQVMWPAQKGEASRATSCSCCNGKALPAT